MVMNETRKKIILLIILTIGNFFLGCTFAIQSPFFPKEAENKGANPSQYGLVFGVYRLTFFILAPIYGKLIGYISPNFMLLAGIFLVGGSVLLFGFLQMSPNGLPFLALAYALRIVEGIGSAAYQVSSFTIIASEFRNNVAKTLATLEMALGIGIIIAPTLGGGLYQIGGFILPFVSLGACILLSVMITYFILPTCDSSNEMVTGGILRFWINPSVILDATIISTSCMCVGYMQSTLEPHLRQFQLSPIIVGVVFVTSGLTYSVSAPVWGYICDHKVNSKYLSLVGCTFLAIGYLFIGPAPFLNIPTKLWLVIVSLVIIGIGLSSCYVAPFIGCLQYTTKVRGYPDDLTTYGLVSSMAGSAQSFGNFIGPSLGGYLLQQIGFPWGSVVFMGAESLLIIIIFIYICQSYCMKKMHRKNVYTSINNNYDSLSN